MPTAMTKTQGEQLRDAGIPCACDGAITDIICALDKHNITLNWVAFIGFLGAADPVNQLKLAKDFVGCFDPKP